MKTLHIPARVLRQGLSGPRLARQALGRDRTLAPRFALSSRERAFALELLRRKPNYRLYRCHQGAFCGDFALVDMSSPVPSRRRLLAIELKLGARLRLGTTGIQLARFPAAAEELAVRDGVVSAGAWWTPVTGSKEAVLAWLVDPSTS